MNTTDQTFIRAYGSDFVPSYADEAARADYPALADSNVNAVFGSRPQQHYRVDGPSTTPPADSDQAAGSRVPTPMPARPYLPQQPAATPPLPASSIASSPDGHGQLEQVTGPSMPAATRQPEAAIADTTNAAEAPRQVVEPTAAAAAPEVHQEVSPPTPNVTHARVPRPHIKFPATKAAAPLATESQATEAQATETQATETQATEAQATEAQATEAQATEAQATEAQATEESPTESMPAPPTTPDILSVEDGLSILADSSVLIGSSGFAWPTLESPVAEAPSLEPPQPVPSTSPEVSQPTKEVAEPATAASENVASVVAAQAGPTEPSVAAEVAAEVEAEEPSIAETLNPAIANVDKEALGAAMQDESDEPAAARRKLKPAWEVDRLLWPADADQLYESESEYFRHAGEKLRDASHEGLRVLGISSSHAGEGSTTLAICLACAAAAAGAKVALFDGNVRSPQLGTALGLDFARSWHETLNGTTPLAEAAVTAIADHVTLIPLAKNASRQGVTLDSDDVNEILAQASETFDLVLVDVGSPCEDGRNGFRAGDACPLDAAIIVRDVRTTSEEETLEAVGRFRALGIDAVGVAENFASSVMAQAAA